MPCSPNSCSGREQADPERALDQEALRQPARPGEGGQRAACRSTRRSRRAGRPGPRCAGAPPEQPAEDGRGELRHRREGDQADGDQGVDPRRRAGSRRSPAAARRRSWSAGSAGEPANRAVAEARRQPRAGATEPLAPAAQPSLSTAGRHDQVVGHHRGQRDGLDDDHAGGGRQAADEDEQREQLLAWPSAAPARSVRVDVAAAEDEQAAEAIGSTKRLITQQVEREQPDRRSTWRSSTFSTTATWNWRGRQQDREHGQHDEPEPVAVRRSRVEA